MSNKKVLLRERKRHTARRVVSTPSVVLPGYPPRGVPRSRYPPGGVPRPRYPPGGVPGPWYPPPPGGGGGVPRPRYPPPPPRGGGGGVYPDLGPPGGGTRTSVPPRGTRSSVPPPPGGGTQTSVPPGGVPGPRYPPGGGGGSGYPPGCLMAFWEMLQSIMGYGYPPPVDRQIDGWTDACQNITFPRTTYAGGNYNICSYNILVINIWNRALCSTIIGLQLGH